MNKTSISIENTHGHRSFKEEIYYNYLKEHLAIFSGDCKLITYDNLILNELENQITDIKKFSFKVDINPSLNIELTYYVLRKILTCAWGIQSYRTKYRKILQHLEKFLKENYSHIYSIFDINENELQLRWNNFLIDNNIKVKQKAVYSDKQYKYATTEYNFIKNIKQDISSWFTKCTDYDVWADDIWDVRDFTVYNFSYVKSSSHYKLNFTQTDSIPFRILLKKYIRRKLLEYGNFVWGTAGAYISAIGRFMNFISEKHTEWENFKKLERQDILDYIEHLGTKPVKDKTRYITYNLTIISSFLEYIQLLEFEEAPLIPVIRLIMRSDYSKRKDSYYGITKYVPEYVLNQLFKYANELPFDTRAVICIMYNTGLRISDTLELNYECIELCSGQYWITSDIIKTKIKEHRIPISDDLAELIKKLIAEAKEKFAEEQNPHHYIFCSERKMDTMPISQKKITVNLNKLAQKYNIKAENGTLYHFKNHPFRHSFAVGCLNGGMDIITLQDILGHASPEMTLAYAKLLDTTKKELFQEVLKSGVFSFKSSTELTEEELGDINDIALERFWMAYKLNAIDTPYGVCMQRSQGKCTYAIQPPCLTCRGGEPCKDLCIGVSNTDVEKYKVLLSSTKSMIDIGKMNGREDMIKENQELYNRYSIIYDSIKKGNIIYGRANRIVTELRKE